MLDAGVLGLKLLIARVRSIALGVKAKMQFIMWDGSGTGAGARPVDTSSVGYFNTIMALCV